MTIPPLLTSHSSALQDGILAALADDARPYVPELKALLTDPFYFAGTAPRGAHKAYIVWLDGSERPRPSYGGGGTEGSDTLKIVAQGPGGREAKRIYARLVAALSYPYPALAAPNKISSLRTTLVQCLTDPEDANGLTVSGLVRLDWRAYASQA